MQLPHRVVNIDQQNGLSCPKSSFFSLKRTKNDFLLIWEITSSGRGIFFIHFSFYKTASISAVPLPTRIHTKSPIHLCHARPNGFGLFYFRYSFSGDGQSHSQLHAPAERKRRAGEKQGQQSAAKQQAGNEPAAICAFITAQSLNATVQNQGDHGNGRPGYAQMKYRVAQCCSQNSHQLAGAAGTNREPPPMIMKRPVIPAMAAAETRQPDIKPGNHPIIAMPTPAATSTT